MYSSINHVSVPSHVNFDEAFVDFEDLQLHLQQNGAEEDGTRGGQVDEMGCSSNDVQEELPVHLLSLLSPDETAFQLFQRGFGKPIHTHPYLPFFEDAHRVRGLRPGDIIEISGPKGCGKTEILLQFIVLCILPRKWNDIQLGGNETSVLFFDLDLRFDILRLTMLLQHHIKRALQEQASSSSSLDFDQLLTETLTRLRVIRCYDATQFLATVRRLRREKTEEIEDLTTMPTSTKGGGEMKTRVILIDSLSAFLWSERQSETFGLQRQRLFLSELQKLVSDHSSLLIYSKPTLFPSPSPASSSSSSTPVGFIEYFGRPWEQLPKFRIQLSPNLTDLRFHPSHPSYVRNSLEVLLGRDVERRRDQYFFSPSFVAQLLTVPSSSTVPSSFATSSGAAVTPTPVPHQPYFLFSIDDTGLVFKSSK